MTKEILLRKAVDSDRAFLLMLRNQSMNTHIINAGLNPNNTDHITRIDYRFDCAQIITMNNHDIGLLKVIAEGSEWDLVQIQLLPEYQGMGIGKYLIERVLASARSAFATVKLSVFKSNPAKKLYVTLGFAVYEETETTFEMKANP